MKKLFLTVFLMLLFLNTSLAQEINETEFFPLSEVKPGLKGVGRTIFAGDKTEEFEVEILGKYPSIVAHPSRSVIIMRLKSPQTDRSGVFSGMSGSPVFINGKLLGAIAYSFPLSKEPIGAITPIQDMLSVFSNAEQSVEERYDAGMSFQELVAASVNPNFNINNNFNTANSFSFTQPKMALTPLPIDTQAILSVPALTPFLGQNLMPIATPLAVSGIDPTAFQYFARGDLSAAAFGTVTWRDKDKIYAFGHPFFAPGGIGGSTLPMSESSVVTIVPSISNSFKLGVSEKLVGAMVQDRATGIYGRLGVEAKLVPLKVNITTSRGKKQTYKMEIASDPFLTPLLVQFSTLNSIVATERSLGDLTINLEGKIKLKDQPQISFGNSFSAASSYFSAILYAGYPISTLYSSGFPVDVEEIEIDIKSNDRRASGSLLRVSLDKTEVKRGEKVLVQAFARNQKGETYIEKIPVTIPMDAPLGKLNLTIGDGTAMAVLEQRTLINANPKDLAALVKAISNLPRNDRLYVKLYYPDTGAIINNQAMPSLPPSMMATLDSDRSTGGYLALPVANVLTQEVPPASFLIGGQQTITIKVVQ
ncbi:MAG: hypothetical protein IPK14_26845 [Blastocatellia bacterium]|nr:hypothetical protein [Blastocatellia bacterium]